MSVLVIAGGVFVGVIALYVVGLLCRICWEITELAKIRARNEEIGAFIDLAGGLTIDDYPPVHRLISERQKVIREDLDALTSRRTFSLGVLR